MAKLTRTELENHLWKSADILRGSIDSSDYKIYIFGFLFLKRLSDRFEEEAQECIRKGLSKDIAYNDPDEHEFFLAERARWSELKKLTTGIGDQLNKACAAIEDANPSIEGVLANIDFNSESRLGDAKNREGVLARLIDHFSRIDLSNASLSEPDMLGRAYEYLIDKFADDAGKKGGEFYTPHPVVRLIVELLDPKPGMRISDPTCGSGGMLIESARHIADIEGKRLGQPVNVTLHGQEKNLGTWAIAKMNLLLHGLRDARIEKGDTIRNPRLLDNDGNLILYDRVIANPPFSLDAWGADDVSGENEKKSFNRFIYGIPPKNMGDLAFVQHMVATLNAKGVCGVVMPHGVLFRGSGDGRIREGMLKGGFVRGDHWSAGEPVRGHRHSRDHSHSQQGQAEIPQGQGAVHPRREGIRGAAQEEHPWRGQYHPHRRCFPGMAGRRSLLPCRGPQGDRGERFQPQHLPLHRHVGAGKADRRESRTRQVVGCRKGAGRSRRAHERPSEGDGLCRAVTTWSQRLK